MSKISEKPQQIGKPQYNPIFRKEDKDQEAIGPTYNLLKEFSNLSSICGGGRLGVINFSSQNPASEPRVEREVGRYYDRGSGETEATR